MSAVVEKMVTRLKDYQATAVPPVRPEGCNPVIDERDAWRPCDSPEVRLQLGSRHTDYSGYASARIVAEVR